MKTTSFFRGPARWHVCTPDNLSLILDPTQWQEGSQELSHNFHLSDHMHVLKQRGRLTDFRTLGSKGLQYLRGFIHIQEEGRK